MFTVGVTLAEVTLDEVTLDEATLALPTSIRSGEAACFSTGLPTSIRSGEEADFGLAAGARLAVFIGSWATGASFGTGVIGEPGVAICRAVGR
jgi:hypothetical protein